MKKVLVAVAMVMGLGTSVAFASTSVGSTAVTQIEQTSQDEFKSIGVNELPSGVIDALSKCFDGGTIKEAFVAEKAFGKVFKVVAIPKDGQETAVYFNEKGEPVTEAGELMETVQEPELEEQAVSEQTTELIPAKYHLKKAAQ